MQEKVDDVAAICTMPVIDEPGICVMALICAIKEKGDVILRPGFYAPEYHPTLHTVVLIVICPIEVSGEKLVRYIWLCRLFSFRKGVK